jgi:phasin family protein
MRKTRKLLCSNIAWHPPDGQIAEHIRCFAVLLFHAFSSGDSPMSTFNPDQLAATNKANIETLLSLTNSAFANAERLAALNLNTARSVLEDSVSSTKALLGTKDVQELVSLQASLIQPLLEKSVSYARSVYEIASQGQEELAKVLETQLAELNKNVSSALDKAAKSAPVGSDVAVAAVKSAIAAANSAYDNFSKAVKQATEIAEANVAAATNATVKAVGTTTKATSSKKSA